MNLHIPGDSHFWLGFIAGGFVVGVVGGFLLVNWMEKAFRL